MKNDYPECVIIESKVNHGFAKGNNLAVNHSSGKYILYLNPDTELNVIGDANITGTLWNQGFNITSFVNSIPTVC